METVRLLRRWSVGPAIPFRHTWVRRRDPRDVEALARSFNRSYGPGRDLMLRAYGVHVTVARWLVSTPDPERLAGLLQRVTHLGKLRAHGLGELGGAWSVTDADGDRLRTLVDLDGRAARTLPTALLGSWEGRPERAAAQPPYWHPARQVVSVPAGRRVALIPALLEAVC